VAILGATMLGIHARPQINRVTEPIARRLAAMHVTPDALTIVGTLGVAGGALGFYPRGEFFVGTVVITVFVFSDTLDGTMARLAGRPSAWGAFLDSTMDRIADICVFAALLWWFAGPGDQPVLAGVVVACLVGSAVVPYAKARAESVGYTADVGLFERSERLVIALAATGLDGLGVPYIQAVALWVVAVASAATAGQRIWTVRTQVRAAEV
jgi:CDP-diacylglycerol--glycerol-3-phosphate 3-phosphatidyltransferase